LLVFDVNRGLDCQSDIFQLHGVVACLVHARLLLEGVLYLLAGIFQVGLHLIRPAFIPGLGISGGLADGFFGPAAQVLDLFLNLSAPLMGSCLLLIAVLCLF